MKIKKYLLGFSIFLLLISLSTFLTLNIIVNINDKRNKLVLDKFNNIFEDGFNNVSLEYSNNNPNLHINGNDYIGIITIENEKKSIPVESNCNNSFLNIQAACNYLDNYIIGTNLKDSFLSFNKYEIGNKLYFTNMLGETYPYKINDIKRIDNLNNITKVDTKFVIVVKNFYNIEYVLFECIPL